MTTPVDYPLKAIGGMLYCKLLSPAKALDWMYTDSLRQPSPLSNIVNEGLLPPMKLFQMISLLFIVYALFHHVW